MPDYQIFGGILRSTLTFPELTPTSGRDPRWVLDSSPGPSAPLRAALLGREEVEPGVQVALIGHAAGLRLAFDDTGTFDISADGARIAWAPPATPDLGAVRKDVLGRVLAVALHQQGILSLHGSAVELGGVAVAFLAPKFHGKSTTAAALVDRGARLLADDIVAVTPGPRPEVLPSVPFIQLWQDSAARVASESSQVPGDEGGRKLQRRWDGPERNATAPAPLDAIYLLAPVPAGKDAGVARTKLSPVEATLALLGHMKVANLLGVERRAALLQTTGALADQVPVYRLDIPRDFARLPELTAALGAWHGAGRAPGKDG